jgi:hypothetical protein
VTARRVSAYLIRRIPEVAAEPRWGGGLSRADLAAALRVGESDRVFVLSLITCYRRRQVDLWRDYVIAATDPFPEQPWPPGDPPPF